LAHLEAKKFIKDDLPLVICMPGGVYGPGDESMIGKTINDFIHRKLPVALNTTSSFTYVHVEDVARGFYQAIKRGKVGESYILAGQVCTVPEILEYLEEISGVAPPKLSIRPKVAKFFSYFRNILPASLREQVLSKEEVNMVDDVTWAVTYEKAKKQLNWEPRPLKEGLKETIEWYQKHPL
jgi:nucleoside-diphosphate-sugar epimerase